jgi:hypothetical protein
MTSLIFLVVAVAMILAVRGQRALAVGLFVLAFAASAFWLGHHMTDPLTLSL